ncbi:MAG: hypothetical protein IJG36_05885 [Synergistaceae bacterium]|nr:hypothetical protein [Synergistaceae bacterium]MBQ3758817.1 hypothetical protein [Synergistaceae bacterium]
MKKMFVAIPPKYGMTHEELEAFRKCVEETAYRAITQIGEYCEIDTSNDFCLTEAAETYYDLQGITMPFNRMYVGDCMKEMCDSDYAVFGTGWESSRECRALRHVAEELGIPILEMSADKEGVKD